MENHVKKLSAIQTVKKPTNMKIDKSLFETMCLFLDVAFLSHEEPPQAFKDLMVKLDKIRKYDENR